MKMIKYFLLLFTFFIFCSSVYAKENTIDLSKSKWQYIWGDSTFSDNMPDIIKNSEKYNWQNIEYPSNPDGRGENQNIWFRVKIPQNLPDQSFFYTLSMDINAQVYLKDQLLYEFGKINIDGKGDYIGWPWHMFSLPKDSEGEYLYFRLYSDYIDIGFFGDILITSKGVIYEKFLDKDIPKLMVSAISIFVSLLFIISFLINIKRTELLILGTLFLTQGVNVLLNVKILQIYFYYPLFCQYVSAFAFFYFPVGMAMFMDKCIDLKTPFNIIRRVWQVHLSYLLIAMIGSVIGYFTLATAYEYFDLIYYFITLPVLSFFTIYFFIKGNTDTKLIASSFLIITLYRIYSFLIAYHIVPWAEYPSEVVIFISLVILSYTIVKKLNYTNTLEDKNKDLIKISITDFLTKLYNRSEIENYLLLNEKMFKRYETEFSIIIFDLDNFKEINDNFGHLQGDDFLIKIGEIVTSVIRNVDIAGRWGGEEFLIICPETKLDDAVFVAEKIRVEIEKYDFKVVGKRTASFGVSSYKKDDTLNSMIKRADDSMYDAKKDGKNKVKFKK